MAGKFNRTTSQCAAICKAKKTKSMQCVEVGNEETAVPCLVSRGLWGVSPESRSLSCNVYLGCGVLTLLSQLYKLFYNKYTSSFTETG
jgi:hypothetical protein